MTVYGGGVILVGDKFGNVQCMLFVDLLWIPVCPGLTLPGSFGWHLSECGMH